MSWGIKHSNELAVALQVDLESGYMLRDAPGFSGDDVGLQQRESIERKSLKDRCKQMFRRNGFSESQFIIFFHLAKCVHQRGLAVVDVAHNGNDGGAGNAFECVAAVTRR